MLCASSSSLACIIKISTECITFVLKYWQFHWFCMLFTLIVLSFVNVDFGLSQYFNPEEVLHRFQTLKLQILPYFNKVL